MFQFIILLWCSFQLHADYFTTPQINIDPESLKPKLPSKKDLRPYPKTCYLEFKGHSGPVRSLSVEATGQWIASGMDCWYLFSMLFLDVYVDMVLMVQIVINSLLSVNLFWNHFIPRRPTLLVCTISKNSKHKCNAKHRTDKKREFIFWEGWLDKIILWKAPPLQEVVSSSLAWHYLMLYLFFSEGSSDGTIRVWEVETGRCLKVFNVGADVHRVSWNPSPDRPILAAIVYAFAIP